MIKKCESCGIKYKYYDYLLEYANFKDDLIEYKCLCFNKNYQQKFDEKLKKQFLNMQKHFNHDNNKFTLLLRKGVHPYEYMDEWEKLNETLLSEKKKNMRTQKEFVKTLKYIIQENIIICMFKAIHYCQLIYLVTFQICVLRYKNLILQVFFQLLY